MTVNLFRPAALHPALIPVRDEILYQLADVTVKTGLHQAGLSLNTALRCKVRDILNEKKRKMLQLQMLSFLFSAMFLKTSRMLKLMNK